MVPSTILNVKEYGGTTFSGPKRHRYADIIKHFTYEKSGLALKMIQEQLRIFY